MEATGVTCDENGEARRREPARKRRAERSTVGQVYLVEVTVQVFCTVPYQVCMFYVKL